MVPSQRTVFLILIAVLATGACRDETRTPTTTVPTLVVDLGMRVTADLPELFFGRRMLEANGFDRPNSVEPLPWTMERWGGSVSGRNAYVSVFNHGGPHVDAPNHIGLPGGLETFPVDAFVGPLKVFDVRDYPVGRSVPTRVFEGHVEPGDVVLILTGYESPRPGDLPDAVTVTWDAAQYLATLPVRAFGTDAFSVGSSEHPGEISTESPIARAMPVHWSFLSRGIPIYEQLRNLEQLLDHDSMYFIGMPPNVERADGMIVRPVVLIY